MKSQQEEVVINAVKEYDYELAQKIIDEMFLFENLIEMDNCSMHRLLQEVENDSLVIALTSRFDRCSTARLPDGYQQGLTEGHQAGTLQAQNEMATITQQW